MTSEKTKKNKSGSLRYLINHRFGKTFLKNWALVFLCITIPLAVCSVVIHDYSRKSILNEMEADIQRSAENTTATIGVLMDEACLLLKKTIINNDVVSFCTKEQPQMVSYGDIQKKKKLLDIVSSNYRESLYYSVDLFAASGNQVISSLLKAQNYDNVRTSMLKEKYTAGRSLHPGQNLFAGLRTVNDSDGRSKRLITIYLTSTGIGDKSFVSISIDNDKLEVPVGFKHISAAIDKYNAVLGGESSGGLTVRGHIHGKDSIYAAALFTEMYCRIGKKPGELIKELREKYGDSYFVECNVPITAEQKERVAEICRKAQEDAACLPEFSQAPSKVSCIDGIKVYFPDDSFVICRPSGTEPLLRIFAEGRHPGQADEYIESWKAFLS